MSIFCPVLAALVVAWVLRTLTEGLVRHWASEGHSGWARRTRQSARNWPPREPQ